MIKVVSFDVGGTLSKIPEGKNLSDAIMNILENEQEDEKEVVKASRLKDLSIEDFYLKLKEKQIKGIKQLLQEYEEVVSLYEDVYDTLIHLKQNGYSLITISNNISFGPEILKKLRIKQYFDMEVYSYQLGVLKPDKKMFQYAMEYYGYNADSFIHIGDSLNDILGANRVGWKSVLLDRNRKYEKIHFNGLRQPNYTIHHLYELEHLLNKQ